MSAGQVVQMLVPQRMPPGHEQAGVRPCVVIGDFAAVETSRFPMVWLVPLTSVIPARLAWATAQPALYPRLAAGACGAAVAVDSIALLDPATALDAGRVVGLRGTLAPAELAPLLASLQAELGR